MTLRLSTLGLLAAALMAPLATARAADLDENYGYAEAPQDVPMAQIPQTKVEFGTGWYVRGDVGVTRLPALSVTAPGTDYQIPPTQFGSGPRVGYDASLGGGYQFNRYFRSDIIADFHQPVSVRQYGHFYPGSVNQGTCQAGQDTVVLTGSVIQYFENCSSNYSASIHSFDVLVNGYFDIGHWGIVTPYVGAGVGLAFGRYSSGVTYTQSDGTPYNIYFTDSGSGQMFHGFRDVVASGNYYNFAFALMAGVSFDIYAHTKLDIGYRYLDEGKVLGATLYSQEVRAGLRYMIDN